MRGIGRYDQRGSLTDALKQGLATTAFGAGTRYLGGASPMGGGLTGGFTSPIQQGGPISRMYEGLKPAAKTTEAVVKDPTNMIPQLSEGPQSPLNKILYGSKEGAPIFGKKGLIGEAGSFGLGKAFGSGVPAVFAGSTLASLAIQKAMGDVGGREPGESLTAFNKRRENTVSQYLEYYFKRANKFRIAPENMDAAAAKFVRQNTTEYRTGENQGGRVGLKHGTPEAGIKSLEAGAPDITYEGDMRMASAVTGGEERDIAGEMWMKLDKQTQSDYGSFENYFKSGDWIEGVKQIDPGWSRGPVLPSPEDPINPFAPKPTGPVLPDKMMAAQGGRIGQLYGTGPAGLPGIPRQAPDGMEFDMRQNGGFQGLGAKEGKDDVPAMLAKNEFVFTADAVRGAGGGDIELGAQRMYDTMKNLEKRVV
jgi:hypothetical protein